MSEEIKKEHRFKKGNTYAVKYKPEYCTDILKYFEEAQEKVTILYEEEYYKDGSLKYKKPVILPPKLPTLEKYAFKISVDMDTLKNWTRKYPSFRNAYARAKEIQLCIIKENAMNKQYDSNFAKFLCVNNHDMADKINQDMKFTDNSFEITIKK